VRVRVSVRLITRTWLALTRTRTRTLTLTRASCGDDERLAALIGEGDVAFVMVGANSLTANR